MNSMQKHKYNIFPEAKAEDFARLRDDIIASGFDQNQPITIFQGAILDGWNRQRACDEIGIKPTYTAFSGTDADAIAFVMRTNKRRNLNSGQWACIAAEADDLLAVIRDQVERERIEKQKANAANQHQEALGKKLPQPSTPKDDQKTATKAAELFNTNRTYVNQAVKMKEQAPDVFEQVKAGKMTMQDANKAVRAIPTDPWSDDENQRKAKVESGFAVIANQQRDKNLIQWAERNGKAVRIDRGSPFGNPFILGDDGDRDQVCNAYRDHYMPHKPSILNALPSLKGKVLICHCYPERCHGESLLLSPTAKSNGPTFPDNYPESHKPILSLWWQHKKEKGKGYKPTGWTTLCNVHRTTPPDQLAADVQASIASNYDGIHPAKANGGSYSGKRPANADDIPPASSEPGYIEPVITDDRELF